MAPQQSDDGLIRIVVIVLGILVLFPVLMMAFAMPLMGMMGWGWSDGMGGTLSPFWGMGMMVVWLLVLLGIGYLIYRGLSGGPGTGRASDPALEELRLAYARGDLSEEEFEERRTKLRAEE